MSRREGAPAARRPQRRENDGNGWGEVRRADVLDVNLADYVSPRALAGGRRVGVARRDDDESPGSARSSVTYHTDDDGDSSAVDFESGAEDLEDSDEEETSASAAAANRGGRGGADELARGFNTMGLGGGGGRGGGGGGGVGEGGGGAEITEAEVREAFAAFDEDGDGLLDARDVKSFFEALGQTVSTREASEMLRTVDGDGDGRVNFEEFFDLATRSAQFFE